MLTPLVLALGRRFPLDTSEWKGNLAVHLAYGVAVPCLYLTLCHVFVFLWFRPAEYRPTTPGREFMLSFAANLHLEILTYWIVLGLQQAYRIFSEREAQRAAAAALETRIAEAELAALKMQLQPHFLFNTLNAISALVRDDPDTADRMLARLGDVPAPHARPVRPPRGGAA